MASRKKRDVEDALKRKGFRQAEGDHHRFIYWTLDGRKTVIRTKTSHGSSQDLGDGLVKEMARQLKVSKTEFLGLVDCPVSREQYEGLLAGGDYI